MMRSIYVGIVVRVAAARAGVTLLWLSLCSLTGASVSILSLAISWAVHV